MGSIQRRRLATLEKAINPGRRIVTAVPHDDEPYADTMLERLTVERGLNDSDLVVLVQKFAEGPFVAVKDAAVTEYPLR